MRFLNQYNKQIVKYDLINKFNYKTVLTIPELEYIILNFNLKKSDTKLLISLLSSLKLISLKNPKITTSKTSNIVFKIRKGQPVGCQLTLRNFTMYKFLLRLINKTVPFKKTYKVTNSLYSLTLKNILIFNELGVFGDGTAASDLGFFSLDGSLMSMRYQMPCPGVAHAFA